jgi:hypothetical protein
MIPGMKLSSTMAAVELVCVLHGIKTPQTEKGSSDFSSTLARLQEWSSALTELTTILDTNHFKPTGLLVKLDGQLPKNNEPTKG